MIRLNFKHKRSKLRDDPDFQLVKDWLIECCFTSTETVGLLGTGAQDGHLHFHTAPELKGRRCALYTLESGSAVEYAVQKTGQRK